MSTATVLSQNLDFWHWYPRPVCEGLTDEQLHWQPENHPNHIMFTLWHAYRTEDGIVNGMLRGQPTVFDADGWAERLPVAEPGQGTGFTREQVAAVHLDLDTVLEYADAVCASVQEYVASLTDEQAAEEVALPFFERVYGERWGKMTRAGVIAAFSVGHVCEHLGEVQYIKGLMGLEGAPL